MRFYIKGKDGRLAVHQEFEITHQTGAGNPAVDKLHATYFRRGYVFDDPVIAELMEEIKSQIREGYKSINEREILQKLPVSVGDIRSAISDLKKIGAIRYINGVWELN